MPKPKPTESKSEYIDRCMADSDMNDEYPSSSERYAVCSGIYKTEMASKEKISFDYDGTLSTDAGKELAKKLINEGNTLYIISARQDKQGMVSTAKEVGIPLSRIYATGSNKAKIEKVIELNISKHFDNNKSVVDALKGIGEVF